MGAMASQITSLTTVIQPFIQTHINETLKFSVTGLCVTGEFPAQIGSNAENVSIWCRYHELSWYINLYIEYMFHK